MRRSLLMLSLILAASLAFAAPAAALTGSGTWNHLGTNGATPAGASLNAIVNEMYVGPDGVFYVGGAFKNAGGIAAADLIAKFDGKTWSSIGTTPLSQIGTVKAIAVAGGKVYVGGNFLDGGGDAAADYLAVYDGVSWKPFCNATASAALTLEVNALQIIGTKLYVGGPFYDANNVSNADGLIACDLATGAMSPLFSEPSSIVVHDLATDAGGRLYAGGNFADLGGVGDADRVAWYDGTTGTWHGLSATAIGGIVRSLHTKGTDVYIGADNADLAGLPNADFFVKWNGSTTDYSAVGSNSAGTNGYFPPAANVYEIASAGSLVFAAGTWQNANGDPTGDMIAYFDGSVWRPVGSNGAGNGPWYGDTQALAVFGGQLYAGGAISNGGGDPKAMFAASRSLRLPDAQISGPAGAAVGLNVYNGTATGQTKTITAAGGTSKTFSIVVWNKGLLPATFTLKGTNAGAGYTVKYVEDWSGTHQNITAAVNAGTYVTPEVAPTFGYPMLVTVTLSSTAASTGNFVVKASSTLHTPKDAVKGIVNRT